MSRTILAIGIGLAISFSAFVIAYGDSGPDLPRLSADEMGICLGGCSPVVWTQTQDCQAAAQTCESFPSCCYPQTSGVEACDPKTDWKDPKGQPYAKISYDGLDRCPNTTAWYCGCDQFTGECFSTDSSFNTGCPGDRVKLSVC